MPHEPKDVETEIIEVLKEWLPARREISQQSNFVSDLGFDSARIVDVVMDIEGRFDITIPVDQIVEIETVADLIHAVSAILRLSRLTAEA